MDKLNTKANILVVEDDALIRDYVAELLIASGYCVTTARSGLEALELIDGGLVPDLLFTDVMIAGGMNGIALAHAARCILPEIKVLFMSGYAGPAGEEQLPTGAKFLQKPFRRVRCIEQVQIALAKLNA